jgi:hypothetical protein
MRYQWFGPGDGAWMIVGLLLLIALIVVTVCGGAPDRDRPVVARLSADRTRPSPTDILRERFARGEITEEQFEQARKVLGRGRLRPPAGAGGPGRERGPPALADEVHDRDRDRDLVRAGLIGVATSRRAAPAMSPQ